MMKLPLVPSPPLGLLLLLVVVGAASAYMTTTPGSQHHRVVASTALSALPPPMIIGPMIKKMREKEAEKNKPMAQGDEVEQEAPGLRIGKSVWKWPPVWPYDSSLFLSSIETQAITKKKQMDAMGSMLTGVPSIPKAEEEEKKEEVKLDSIDYWTNEQANATTFMSGEAAQKLTEHFAYYLKDDISILEFGAAEKSYLPPDLKIKRHVGVGASQKNMDQNPSLTESMVVDLNNVVKERDIDSDDLRVLAKDPFDVVIMTNTVEFLLHPREVFRSAWYLLKPGGTMFVAFRGKEASKNDFTDAQTTIWSQYNDDQHMWITGSFFQFSAGDGWESLMGFDISPESAKPAQDGNPLSKFLQRGTGELMFVVQATKGFQYDSIDLGDLEKSIGSLCWMLPTLEDRDKGLVVPRLARALETANDPKTLKDTIQKNIDHLPKIYEVLARMDQFAFTFNMQSQMAADLVCDADFEANEEQVMSLKEGLGLKTPGDDFWKPVGENTAAMAIEDKISLLAHLVPRFGSNNPLQEAALQTFVTGLKPTYTLLRSKCPELSEEEVELMGTEFLAAEMLRPGVTTRQEYAAWLAGMEAGEIRELLSLRKAIREDSKTSLAEYKEAREDRKKRIEEYRNKMQEQIAKARNERTLIFNPRTEKMEKFEVRK